MKILVTGATGSLGTRLVQHWQGVHELTATGRRAFQGSKDIRFLQGDLADPVFADLAVKDQDVVVHCAALASAWGEWPAFYKANVVATLHIVNACRHAGVKQLVHISTPSIYFSPQDRRQIREEDPVPPPATNYAKSKLMAEELVKSVKGSSLRTVMLRPRGIFGPTDQVILPKILRLLRKGFFPYVRGGHALIDLTHVDNVIYAIDCCLKNVEAADGEAFNISNGEPIEVRELVDLISQKLGLKVKTVSLPVSVSQWLAGLCEASYRISGSLNEPPITKYGLGLLSFDQTLDISKARKILGYEPKVKLREGVLSTLEALT